MAGITPVAKLVSTHTINHTGTVYAGQHSKPHPFSGSPHGQNSTVPAVIGTNKAFKLIFSPYYCQDQVAIYREFLSKLVFK